MRVLGDALGVTMRRIVFIIFAGFAIWAGLWVYGEDAKTERAENWFVEQQEQGWIAEYDELDVRGFPNRYDTYLKGVKLADTDTGWAWDAPELEILSLSYQPNHLILVFPPEHELRTPKEDFLISHSDLKGSVVFEPSTDFELNRSSFEGTGIVWLSEGKSEDHAVTVEDLRVSTRKTPGGVQSHDIAISAKNVGLGPSLLSQLSRANLDRTQFETINFTATAGFRGVWDGPALSRSGPDLRDLSVDNLEIQFSDMRLRATGDLEVDRAGYPTGSLAVRAENWQDIVSMASQNGILSNDVAAAVTTGLELLSRFSGNEEHLDFTLRFSNRQAYAGPFPLGEAPVIWPVQRQ